MSEIYGIDVSQYQKEIDWPKVKATGVEFAILRAGFGRDFPGQTDECFYKNVEGAKAAGVKIGAYHYSYAKDETMALAEADFFLRLIEGIQFEMPVYLDIEDPKQKPLGKEKLTAIAKTFCEKVEAAGYYVGIYASLDWLRNYLDMTRLPYTVWLAQWAAIPSYKGKIDMWQYTSKGRVNGIVGSVDRNICYTDFTKMIKERGLNNFEKSTAVPVREAEARLLCRCGDLLNVLPCKLLDGVAYIPARAAFETFGYKVDWDGRNVIARPPRQEEIIYGK